MGSLSSAYEVPLPPPERPERKEERQPEYERVSIGVGAASVWVGDVQRNAREFAERHSGAVSVEIELESGRRLRVQELRAGPGEGFVTLRVDERELAVRLDRVAGVELAPAEDPGAAFRVRDATFGFDAGSS